MKQYESTDCVFLFLRNKKILKKYLKFNLINTIERFHIKIKHRPPNCSIPAFIEDFGKIIAN